MVLAAQTLVDSLVEAVGRWISVDVLGLVDVVVPAVGAVVVAVKDEVVEA